jgi:hypothetical protein
MMWISTPLFVSLMVGLTGTTTVHCYEVKTYKADVKELKGSGVTGTVVVFQGDDEGLVAYGGFASGLEPNLDASTCNATNGYARNHVERRINIFKFAQ